MGQADLQAKTDALSLGTPVLSQNRIVFRCLPSDCSAWDPCTERSEGRQRNTMRIQADDPTMESCRRC